MNKNELLELLDSLNLAKSEYYILGSGSLLLYGIRESSHDLDLAVSRELFKSLSKEYKLNEYKRNDRGFYQLMPNVEIVAEDKDRFNFEYREGYPVEKLETILAFKRGRNNATDRHDIEQIEKYLDLHS